MFATILMDVYETLMLIISDDMKQKKNVFRFVPGTAWKVSIFGYENF